MRLTDLLLSCKADLGYGSVPTLSDETGKRLTRYLNDGYRQIMRLPGFEMLRFQTVEFSTKTLYPWYSAFSSEKIYAMVSTVSRRRLVEMSRDAFRTADPSGTISGTPFAWVPEGFHLTLWPTFTFLYAYSTDPADTTQRLSGTFLDMGGDHRSFDFQLNGNTQLPLSTLYPVRELLTMQLSAVCTGFVYISNIQGPPPYPPASDGRAAGIDPGHYSPRIMLRFRLWPTPTMVEVYQVDVQLPMTELIGPTDEPLIPIDFHNLLTDYAKMREYELRGDDRFEQSAALYNDGLKALKDRVTNPADYRPVAGKYPVSPGSDLGPWFPAGRW